jgi:hypothetical protein
MPQVECSSPCLANTRDKIIGPVAQLGARLNRTEEVRGSNPLRSTGQRTVNETAIQCSLLNVFEYGPIAQLGARLNGIEKVEGSNPSGSTIM